MAAEVDEGEEGGLAVAEARGRARGVEGPAEEEPGVGLDGSLGGLSRGEERGPEPPHGGPGVGVRVEAQAEEPRE